MRIFNVTAAVVAAGLFLASAASAQETFVATLTGSQEVPPVSTAARGEATLTLNAAGTALSYRVDIFGLDLLGFTAAPEDNIQGLHIHRAPVGQNGPIVFGLLGPIGPANDLDDLVVSQVPGRVTISGVWDNNEGNGTTLAAQLANLRSGNLYLNVHTAAFPGGEIRGQIVVPEPGTAVLLAAGALPLLGLVRRRRSRG
jgi:hypothetical protein